MSRLSSILSSRSKGEVLRVLCLHNAPVPLPALRSLTGLRAATLDGALCALEAEGLAFKVHAGKRVLWGLNELHDQAYMLRRIFHLEMFHEIVARADDVTRRAGRVVAFVNRAKSALAGAAK